MFVYIDEAGHTGKNNADQNQPVFYYMSLATKGNLDLDLDNTVKNIKTKHNISELHGVESSDKIEYFALDILNLLRKNSAYFCISVVEKNFLSYAKLYDTIFDNVENKGARFQTYQIRPFRLLMLNNLCGITPIEIAHNFYENCLFANSEEQAVDVMIKTCDYILNNIHKLKDSRSIEIIGDAFTWAKDNPKEITTFNTRKIDRWRHLPHVVGFLPMMSMLSIYSKKHKTSIYKIIHDEQQQVKKVITELHKIAADTSTSSKWDLRENGYYDLLKIKETNFEIKDSSTSFGLQIVDICLYIKTHQAFINENTLDYPNTRMLLDYINDHHEPFMLTTDFFKLETQILYNKIMKHEYTEDELLKGKKIIEQMEDNHKKQKIT